MSHCLWCGVELTGAGTGRPRRYCSGACRTAAYRARELWRELTDGFDPPWWLADKLDQPWPLRPDPQWSPDQRREHFAAALRLAEWIMRADAELDALDAARAALP